MLQQEQCPECFNTGRIIVEGKAQPCNCQQSNNPSEKIKAKYNDGQAARKTGKTNEKARSLDAKMDNHLDKASVETLEWFAEFLQFWLRRIDISLKNRKNLSGSEVTENEK